MHLYAHEHVHEYVYDASRKPKTNLFNVELVCKPQVTNRRQNNRSPSHLRSPSIVQTVSTRCPKEESLLGHRLDTASTSLGNLSQPASKQASMQRNKQNHVHRARDMHAPPTMFAICCAWRARWPCLPRLPCMPCLPATSQRQRH